MTHHPSRPRRQGFTLIELLVVIAIIAILASILFPVFAQAREKARQAMCASNLKQIGTAFHMYAQDYDETFPPWTNSACSGAFNFKNMYYYSLDPYIKNGLQSTSATTGDLKDVWACPTAKGNLPSYNTSYAYNYYTFGGISPSCLCNPDGCSSRDPGAWAQYASSEYNTPAPMASLGKPTETLLLVDGAQLCRPPQFVLAVPGSAASPDNIGIWGSHQRGKGDVPNTATTNSWIKSMIDGTLSVVLYADGHVKAVSTKKLYNKYYVFDGGAWRGEANSNDNAGWARDW